MARPQFPEQPASADLSNPLYYLQNMETVVRWVLRHHRDLLTGAETDRLEAFLNLEVPARALMTRLVMRTGDLFRVDKLAYPELGAPVPETMVRLVADGWLDPAPPLGLDALFRLFTLAELRPVFASTLERLGASRSMSKAAMRSMGLVGRCVPTPPI